MFWQLTNSVYTIKWYKEEHRQNTAGCSHLFGGATEDELWVEWNNENIKHFLTTPKVVWNQNT